MKRAQMEIMGLVIIVILIIVGIFLLLFFGKNTPQPKLTGYNQKLAESFVSTLPEVQLQCDTQLIKVKDMVRACASSSSLTCLSSTPACDFLQAELMEILQNSLSTWNYELIFEIQGLNPAIVIENNPKNPVPLQTIATGSSPSACASSKKKVTAEQPVPLTVYGGNPAVISLKICY